MKDGNKRKHSFSLWSWGLNEESLVREFVETSVKSLSGVSDDFEIILVDDGSADDTWRIMQELKEEYKCLKIVKHPVNMQPGRCMHTCRQHTTKEIVFWNTVDMFFDMSKLEEFVSYLGEYDVVQGVREDRRSNTYRSFYRRMNSVVNYHLIRFLFSVPLHDFQNITFLRWDLLGDIEFDSASSFTNPECVLKAYYKGARIKELKMKHMDRKTGKAKGGRISTVLAAVLDIFKCWFLWRVLRRIKITKGEIVPYYSKG